MVRTQVAQGSYTGPLSSKPDTYLTALALVIEGKARCRTQIAVETNQHSTNHLIPFGRRSEAAKKLIQGGRDYHSGDRTGLFVELRI